MRFLRCRISYLAAVLFLFPASAMAAESCSTSANVAVQVLGSGGPIADDGRASSSYLVWVNGKSRVMIDVGGGAFLRFGEAGASFSELEFVGLSHFHTDHSADFPALLKSGYFSDRNRSLVVAGPNAGGPFPGLNQYAVAMLRPASGAYRYLSGYLDGTGGLARLQLQEVSDVRHAPEVVYADTTDEISVEALHVPHGIVPALGFRVRVGESTMVFASDQNGSDPAFIDFAKDADVLVMHMPIPEGAGGSVRQLHAPPSIMGQIAAMANVDTLLLSHFMARSLRNLDDNVAAITRAFDGRTLVADDLDCIMVR